MASKAQVKQWLRWGAWVAVVALLAILYMNNDDEENEAVETDATQAMTTSNTPQGSPAGDNINYESVLMPRGLSNTVVHYKGYTAHFNKERHIPNCVVYEITAQEARGKRERSGNFERDANVAGCPNWWDYRDSGYDRGHMAPAGDMKWDEQAMNETFYLTNICPQDNALNAGLWNDLELTVRDWARRDKALIVVTGPIVGNKPSTIGQDMDIVVPDAFFKVILAPKCNPMRAIGFICPNRACGGTLKSYAVSVDEVEERTGMNFFNALPDDIETRIEANANFYQWLNQ